MNVTEDPAGPSWAGAASGDNHDRTLLCEAQIAPRYAWASHVSNDVGPMCGLSPGVRDLSFSSAPK